MFRFHVSPRFIGLVALALGACQAIAGIEDRELDPKLAAAKTNSKQCKDYCATVMMNCAGANAVYNDLDSCLGICRLLDPGEAVEPAPNTVACRAKQAENAALEPKDSCKNAGPGGNGVCGSDCEAYCDLYPQVCPEQYKYPDREACLLACSGLPEKDSFDVMTDHGGDTIECRLVHTASSTTNPAMHCAHAPIPPAQPWCAGDPKKAPSCKDYCQITNVACQEDLAQYESPEQCLAVCDALNPGKNSDETGNTVGCRRYHAFNSTFTPGTHCFHAGPTGDGHCGSGKVEEGHTGNCEAYCTIVAAACPEEFATELGDADQCMAACIELPGAAADSKYSVATAEADKGGLNCRVLYATRAFESKTACASALGGDLCQAEP